MHGSENTAPGAQLHAQLQGLSLAAGGAANPTHAGTPAAASASSVAYPPVPRPAAAQPMYPPPTGGAAAAAAAAAGAPAAAAGAPPPGPAGSWLHTAAAPAPPPSSQSAGAPPAAAATPPGPAAAGGARPWLLSAPLPERPAARLIGPCLRFNDYDPSTGIYHASVLVVVAADVPSGAVQLHYGVSGPPSTPAPATVLDMFDGYTFIRFDLRCGLGPAPAVARYKVRLGGGGGGGSDGAAAAAAAEFHLPARGERWRWLFYSCNGFHEHEPEQKYGGIGHLWADLRERHAAMRFHLQVGGGDQIYCDDVWSLKAVLPWVAVDDPHVRARGAFTADMLEQAEQYYFGHYCRHFSDPAMAWALASIPYVYTWDDHDIFDGWGSYPPYLQHSAVFQGLFAVARRFFLLFQLHANYSNAPSASRTLGQLAYHQVRSLGDDVVLAAPDTRSLRADTQVLPPQDWQLVLGDVERRLAAGGGRVRHLAVVLPVPAVYPKLPVAETVIGGISGALARSSEMRAALRAANLPSGAINQFAEADLLDDLKDHWTAAEHAAEKDFLLRRLQDLAARYAVRVTLMSGDVHVGGYGVLQAHPKVLDRVVDPRFMLQVVSSAIGNEPPPAGVVMALETSSMANTRMEDTLEKMAKAFPGKKRLWHGRNYCEVLPLDAPYTEPSTGIAQPPGGLMFALRCESGAPGAWAPVQAFWQVAPLLLPGGNPQSAASLPGGYGAAAPAAGAGLVGGSLVGQVAGQVAALLPGEAGAKLQTFTKKAGHQLGNFLQRF